MTDREQLIAEIDRIAEGRQPDTAWRAKAEELFTRVGAYLAENRSVREIGKKGGTVTRSLLNSEDFAAIGRKGGITTKKRWGRDHYMAIGKIGGEKRHQKKDSEPTS